MAKNLSELLMMQKGDTWCEITFRPPYVCAHVIVSEDTVVFEMRSVTTFASIILDRCDSRSQPCMLLLIEDNLKLDLIRSNESTFSISEVIVCGAELIVRELLIIFLKIC